MTRLRIDLSYDGTRFHGWQRQKQKTHTIQEVIETKLSFLLNQRVTILGSGRTDAGVHARFQVAHASVEPGGLRRFRSASDPQSSIAQLEYAMNRTLPGDIRIHCIREVPESFHAQKGVVRKVYQYFIDPSSTQWPVYQNHSWALRHPLDWEAVEAATNHLVGRFDFASFCASDSGRKTTIREVYAAAWSTVRLEPLFPAEFRVFRIEGNGFLKQMVRGIVGTLILIGSGKAKPGLIRDVLDRSDRAKIGPTAPARGLWLWDVVY